MTRYCMAIGGNSGHMIQMYQDRNQLYLSKVKKYYIPIIILTCLKPLDTSGLS